MPLAHPNLPDELPDEYGFLHRMWTADTHCVHCSSQLGRRSSHPHGVPLCEDCATAPIIAEQYKKP